MIEKKFQYNSISINYKLKSATADKRHLVVIFTGFMTSYNYVESWRRLKSNVLWIADSYDSYESYYIGKNGRFDYEVAVNALIENVLENIFLSKEECTLIGDSKGAFGALYIGLKYDYKNIISIAPLTKIGTWLDSTSSHHAKRLMGQEYGRKILKKYDSLIEEVVKNNINPNRNVYLVLAQQDQFYEKHQKKLYSLLSENYSNVNMFLVKSPLIYHHNRLGLYSYSLSIMLINSLIDGIIPVYNKVVNVVSKEIINGSRKHQKELEPIAILDKIRFDNATIYLSGIALLRGVSVNSYGIYRKVLVLVGSEQTYRYSVGTVLDKSISHSYYQNDYFDYTAGGFADLKGQGIDLEGLPKGLYTVEMGLSIPNIKEKTIRVKSKTKIDVKSISGGYEYRLWDKNNLLLLSKRSIVNLSPSKIKASVFNLEELSISNKRFFISGTFAIPGIELLNWGDAMYYVVLFSQGKIYSYNLGLLNRLENNNLLEDGFGIYQKARFATLGLKGIDVSTLSEAVYDIYIILSYKSSLFKQLVNKKLFVKKGNIDLK